MTYGPPWTPPARVETVTEQWLRERRLRRADPPTLTPATTTTTPEGF